MLWFVGTGVSGLDSIPSRGLEIIKEADFIYLERFTSPITKVELSKIQNAAGGNFRIAERWLVEDGSEILENAKSKDAVLLSYGDPYIATTHIELRTRAAREGIKTGTIHGSSAITSLVGECGLHYYKIGRIATIMNEPKSMSTPYYVTYRNVIDGNHTILLLEYNQDGDFFLEPRTALSYLLDAEKGQSRGVIGADTFAIVASRIGYEDQKIVSGRISRLIKADLGGPPQSIIIPGRMHFTEVDFLKILTECLDEPVNNSDKTSKIAVQMIEKYVPMVRESLKEVAAHYEDPKFKPVLENAELYIRDAERFLQDGMDEVAVLSIGYADGLVDALRMAAGMETNTSR